MSHATASTRRLVAVFAADVEDYSRLMGLDEVGTPKGLTERRIILDKLISEHGGRIANTAGGHAAAVTSVAAWPFRLDILKPRGWVDFRRGSSAADGPVEIPRAVHRPAPPKSVRARLRLSRRTSRHHGFGIPRAFRLPTLASAYSMCSGRGRHHPVLLRTAATIAPQRAGLLGTCLTVPVAWTDLMARSGGRL
jgi:hypothetical protein